MVFNTCIFWKFNIADTNLVFVIIKLCSRINMQQLTNCDIKVKYSAIFLAIFFWFNFIFAFCTPVSDTKHIFQRSNSPICPPLAVCGNVFEFDRMMDDGSVEPERRHITNCFCNNSRVCPFNRENMIYQSRTQQSVYPMASFNWWLYLISTYCIRNCTYLNLWKTIGEHISSLMIKHWRACMNFTCMYYVFGFVSVALIGALMMHFFIRSDAWFTDLYLFYCYTLNNFNPLGFIVGLI